VQRSQQQPDRCDQADHDWDHTPQTKAALVQRDQDPHPYKAIMTTPVAWIAMVSAMSDRPQVQLARSNRSSIHREIMPSVNRAANRDRTTGIPLWIRLLHATWRVHRRIIQKIFRRYKVTTNANWAPDKWSTASLTLAGPSVD
jgi:hypothetical protein